MGCRPLRAVERAAIRARDDHHGARPLGRSRPTTRTLPALHI
jgi:hypothetical protein